MSSSTEKIYVKKLVTKITFISIGAHLIYKFYNMSGLTNRIQQLFFTNEELDNQETIVEYDSIEELRRKDKYKCLLDNEVSKDVNALVSLRTLDGVWLHFKEVGEYKIDNQFITVGINNSQKEITIKNITGSFKTSDEEFEYKGVVSSITII